MKKLKIFTKKKITWTIIILVLIGGGVYFFQRPQNTNSQIQTMHVQRQDIKSTVLTTGQIISKINLNLSFQSSGIVQNLRIKVGDQVQKGDILGNLNQASAQAALVSAQGSLAQAQANYNKIRLGASKEQINVTQKAINSAQVANNNAQVQLAIVKKSSAVNIQQAEKTLQDLQSPTTNADDKRSTIVTNIAQQLTVLKADLNQEKQILDDNDLKDTFGVSNISNLNQFKSTYPKIQALLDEANLSLKKAKNYKSDTNLQQAISDSLQALRENIISLNYCYSALQDSITSSKFNQSQLNAYQSSIQQAISAENSGINVINSSYQILSNALTNAQNALTNTKLNTEQKIISAQNQVNSTQAALEQAQATLEQETAPARASDLAVAQAQILAAQGNVDAAQVRLKNALLIAPQKGTITAVDTKIGQQVNALQEVVVLQNVQALHTEANVSEANIASLKIGQTVDYTFDALGPDRHFQGKIYDINPASTIISGVVDYLIKATLPNIPEIKPGMTANMTIQVASKNQVLAIPSSAIIYQGTKAFVRLVTNPQSKTYRQIPIQIGLQADNGLVEVRSGLQVGQEIVTYLKS